MKNSVIKSLLFLLLLFPSIKVSAQQQIGIDLAKNPDSELTQSVKAGIPIEIIIINRSLKNDYKVKVEKKVSLLRELSLEKDSKNIPLSQSGCTTLKDKITNLYSIKDEKKLDLEIQKLEEILKKLKKPNKSLSNDLKKCSKDQIFETRYTIDLTKEQLLPQTLKKGELLEITISRKKQGSDDEYVVWKRIYTTEKRGKWLTTYGFTYVTQVFKKSEPFFTKQNDTLFAVTPLNKRSKLTFVPSIFFTWFPYKDLEKDCSLSLTGGLGYDLEAPTVFLGANLLYNQNIGISIGIAAHQQEFLNGKYNEGDILMENLESTQLNEKLYALNPYISVSYRFGTAPIKSAASSGSVDD